LETDVSNTGAFDLVNPSFNLKSINISGPIAGVATINGTLDFITNDPVYGNGVAGSLSATFTGLNSIGITIAGRFGNKPCNSCGKSMGQGNIPGVTITSYNYWFLNASVFFPKNPILVATDVGLNGLGGGVYYNMKQTESYLQRQGIILKTVKNSDPNAKDADPVLLSGFAPDYQNGGFNLEAAVCTYADEGNILQAYGVIGMGFTWGKGFAVQSISGGVSADVLKQGLLMIMRQ